MQKMFIEVKCLTRKDYWWGRIGKIEKAITKEVQGRMEELGLTKEDVKFFFPKDTSITSNDVQVIIEISVLGSPALTKEKKDSLAGAAAVAFAFTVGQWRPIKSPQAYTRTFNRDTEGLFFLKDE